MTAIRCAPSDDKVKHVLQLTKAYVTKGWIRYSFAQNAQGITCGELTPHAVCWCLAGAVFRATNKDLQDLAFGPDDRYHIRQAANKRLFDQLPPRAQKGYKKSQNYLNALIRYNDRKTRTQQQIIDLVDRALAA